MLSFMPRSSPDTRENGLVNQVKFLRLACAFATFVTLQHLEHFALQPLKENILIPE